MNLPVTWTKQGEPDLWLGNHAAMVVCDLHKEEFAADSLQSLEPMTPGEIFDFEYDMGQRLCTIALCFEYHQHQEANRANQPG